MALVEEFDLGEYIFPRGWFMIAEASELDDGPKGVRFFGKDFALYRGESGRLVLLDAYCLHMGTHLAKSNSASIVTNHEQLEGDSIRCPYHGWRYNPEGQVDDIPYFDGPCPKARIKSYPVVETLGAIMMWHDPAGGEPDYQAPDLKAWHDSQWINGCYDHLGDIAIHPQEIIDNMADAHHLGPTHGAPCEYFENEYIGHKYYQRQGGYHRMYRAYLTTLTWYTGPGLLLSRQRFGDNNGYEFIFHTPVDKGMVKVWHNNLSLAPGVNPGEQDIANAKMAQEGALAAFAQDLQIWANKKPALQIMALPVERNFRLGRIWYQQFYNPIEKAKEFHARVNGKHHLKGLAKPSALAVELQE
ncbi:Rieske 2Fe-2S domain-containing protein [Microbulbifer spongiae]|uniref:Rieske 2Fe-2S domain-containing protein n=1 Tax=Microbulbifer spongiae TaxID=2944933 RepID=A0ABY9E9F0_9GAMM|nr:Rieske 2Fe-2S domain-containing protein [Microbulbifer sp. MI-G]WKD49075.1 Rieske 2Fe-2S domain-containing protein [Microbulbifer sp. MI-G]